MKETGAYPRLCIDLDILRENTSQVLGLCAKRGIMVTAVTKSFCGDLRTAAALLDGGVTRLGDARVANLKKLTGFPCEKWLIRAPMRSEMEEAVRCCDIALHSEIQTVQAAAAAARRIGKTHGVILMMDLGDLREGFFREEDLLLAAIETERTSGAVLKGIGTNLTCMSFVQSTPENMERLCRLAKRVEEAAGHPLSYVSGGNSAALDLMLRGGFPPGINHLRLGGGLLFGKERAHYTFLPGTRKDAFILECELIEVKEKPSLPIEETGVDSYGRRPQFVDRGERCIRAVCAVGKQDFDLETAVPLDPGIHMIGSSSDHTVLDLTDSAETYRVGDIVRFRLGYFSLLRAATSPYVSKCYQNGRGSFWKWGRGISPIP